MANGKRLARKKQENKQEKAVGKFDIWQDRIAEALVILLMCVLPLYLNSNRYVRLTYHKFVFFIIIMGVILFAVFLVWCVQWRHKFKALSLEKLSAADWAMLGFGAVTIISAIISPYRRLNNVWLIEQEVMFTNIWFGFRERYDGAITQLLYVAMFFIVSRWYKPRERDFGFFALSAVLVALIGVFQFYGMDFFRLWPNHIERYHAENFYNIMFRSTLGNVDIVSTYTCAAVLLCGFLFVKIESKWQFVWLAGSALSFWLMDLANADSGLVGTALALVLAIPFIFERREYVGRFLILASSWAGVYALHKLLYAVAVRAVSAGSLFLFAGAAALLAAGVFLLKWKRKTGEEARAPARRKIGVIIMAAVIAAGLLAVETAGRQRPDSKGFARVAYQMREIMHGNINDQFGSFRVYIWRNALAVFPRHPIYGSGPDTFGLAFPIEAQGRYGQFYDKAHNEYLQLLICQGILGLACYLALLGSLFVKSVSKAFENPLILALLVTVTGYCVQAFFNISVPFTAQLLWVPAGMLAAGIGFASADS